MVAKIRRILFHNNVYGGGYFVAIAIANTLTAHNREIILFLAQEINPSVF